MIALVQFGWVNNVVQMNFFIGASFFLLAAEAALAAFLPKTNKSCFVQILAQAVLISAACALGIHQRSSLYFLVLGAKGATILKKSQLIIFVIILMAGRIGAGLTSQYLFQSVHLHRQISEFYNSVVVETESKLYFCIALITVLFLGRTIVAERRSRSAQSELAKEAERLAIDDERNKIALKIHESMGHLLAQQLIQLELAAKLVQDKQLEGARSQVEQSYDSSVECLRQLRKAVAAMRNSDGQDSASSLLNQAGTKE